MVRERDVRELAAALRTGAVLVDVRERFEYVSGHVPGAMSLPIGELVVRGRELPTSATVYAICATEIGRAHV
jgi:rhodanese-related sulfurtransferase